MVLDVEAVSENETGGFAAVNMTLMMSEQNCELFEQFKFTFGRRCLFFTFWGWRKFNLRMDLAQAI